MQPLRDNERLRFLTTITGNLGAALIATAAARWFANGLDLYVALWLLFAAGLIWTAWLLLDLLDPEAERWME